MSVSKPFKTKAERISEAQAEYDFCVRMHQQYRITARLAAAYSALQAALAA